MRNKDYFGDDVRRPDYLESKDGFEPDKPYYIDVICSNYDMSDPSQVAISCTISADMLCPNSTTEEIEQLFWICFLQDKRLFLDYHYNYFLNRGGKTFNFLEWIEKTFEALKKDKECWQEYIDAELFKEKEEYLHRWINAKKQNIGSEPKLLSTHIKNPALPEIALCYQYLRIEKLHEEINEQNRDEIAKKYNWTAPTSGEKLHTYYKNFYREDERTIPIIQDRGDSGYNRSKRNRIKHLKGAIELLKKTANSAKAIHKAEQELKKVEQR